MRFEPGEIFQQKKILEVRPLPGSRLLLKTEDSKSPGDFLVRYIWRLAPRPRFYTPKHAHFAIDFYGKICADAKKSQQVLTAITEVWHRKPWDQVVQRYGPSVADLPGYDLYYIVGALDWIFEQEDLNFRGRPEGLQRELNDLIFRCGITLPPNRQGSQLAVSLFCRIWLGAHPVEALLSTNIRNL